MANHVCLMIAIILLLGGCSSGGETTSSPSEDMNTPEEIDEVDETASPDPEPVIPKISSFSVPVNISNNETHSQTQSLVISADGVMHLAWIDNADVAFSQSYDNGLTFSQPARVVESGIWNSIDSVKLALTDTALHMSFTVYNSNSGAEVFYMRSMDGGLTFTDPKLVSNDDGHNSYASTISTDGYNRVSIAWSNRITAGQKSRFVLSEDNGDTFSSPAGVYATGSSPRIFLTSEDIYATWLGGPGLSRHNYFTNATSTGEIDFRLSPTILEENVPPSSSQMFVDDVRTLYVTWYSGALGRGIIVIAKSEDKGLSFTEPVMISAPDFASFCANFVFTGIGEFYVTWVSDEDDNGYRTYITKSDDGGETFLEKRELILLTDDQPFCPTMMHMKDENHIGMIYTAEGTGVNLLPDIYYTTFNILSVFD